ncbi:hypothetical protein IG193_07625 [Infirmifilum lucidum]|uniref:Uncharacterized protein n=1 Tax=Infirmifilum lucidum TaxID=2776706 RepID=A0A7L9FFM9_9CREN|nr:hypothetical protein [Infirmifilum lucidum]QOJ78618.1 hypothetical protein IG193_07625 [Infirmifilum lucidum]
MSLIKIVVWALDFTPNKFVQDVLSSQLGEEVVFVGVGPLSRAEEVLEAMRETRAEEAVTAIEDPCEMNKLLEAGVQPLVVITEEVCRAKSISECTGVDASRDIVVEREGEVSVIRVREFARVIDIMFQLVEPSEKHVHHDDE